MGIFCTSYEPLNMTAVRNIGGDGNDLSYRYKMPRLITKVEGRGNGIKTRLVNMHDVGKALHRDPAYATKFFGCELGAQSKINEKNLEYIVNGNHDTKTFDSLLDVFIEKYVLCPNCKLPETDLSVKRQSIYSTCNACGHHAALDSAHRIAQYIIKCPPKERDRVKVKANKAAQKSKEDDELVKHAQALKIKEDADEKWTTDTSVAAVEKRRQQIADGILDLTQAIDDIESDSPIDAFRMIVDSKVSIEGQLKAIRSYQKKMKFGNLQRTQYLFETMFTEEIRKELKPRTELIQALISKDVRLQIAFLGAFEKLLEQHPDLLKTLPDILMGLYDFELVPEDSLLRFFKSQKSKYVEPSFHASVVKAASPFIEWLEEEEDEEGEEEEEEEEAAPAPTPAPVNTTKSVFAASNNDSDDDSDLD